MLFSVGLSFERLFYETPLDNPGIFTWGSTYADRPWDLNGYAITLYGCTVLVDPPAPEEGDWPNFDALKHIDKIILTNRDHVRDSKLFQTRYGARLVAGTDEVTQLAPLAIEVKEKGFAL